MSLFHSLFLYSLIFFSFCISSVIDIYVSLSLFHSTFLCVFFLFISVFRQSIRSRWKVTKKKMDGKRLNYPITFILLILSLYFYISGCLFLCVVIDIYVFLPLISLSLFLSTFLCVIFLFISVFRHNIRSRRKITQKMGGKRLNYPFTFILLIFSLSLSLCMYFNFYIPGCVLLCVVSYFFIYIYLSLLIFLFFGLNVSFLFYISLYLFICL